jgi:hypothetical protein
MRCGAFHRVEGTLCLVRHGQAALSGSKTKAPGFAGGYLLTAVLSSYGPKFSVARQHSGNEQVLRKVSSTIYLLVGHVIVGAPKEK